MEVENLTDAEGSIAEVSVAALEALGELAREARGNGALVASELTPEDDQAHQALRAEDLGPGISSALFAKDVPRSSPAAEPPAGQEDAEFERDLRATNVGEGLAHALIQHLNIAAKSDSELDAEAALHYATAYLRSYTERKVEWATWAAEHDVRRDRDKRQN